MGVFGLNGMFCWFFFFSFVEKKPTKLLERPLIYEFTKYKGTVGAMLYHLLSIRKV